LTRTVYSGQPLATWALGSVLDSYPKNPSLQATASKPLTSEIGRTLDRSLADSWICHPLAELPVRILFSSDPIKASKHPDSIAVRDLELDCSISSSGQECFANQQHQLS
jgi:hypothetical protein